jgi:hypothetical protein
MKATGPLGGRLPASAFPLARLPERGSAPERDGVCLREGMRLLLSQRHSRVQSPTSKKIHFSNPPFRPRSSIRSFFRKTNSPRAPLFFCHFSHDLVLPPHQTGPLSYRRRFPRTCSAIDQALQSIPFPTTPIRSEFFAQVIQFNHCYSPMKFQFLFYAIFFAILKMQVTEASLLMIHVLLGLLTLTAVYFFARDLFNRKTDLMALLLLAFPPVRVGLIIAHVGQQVIQVLFLYSSLLFLHRLLHHPTNTNKLYLGHYSTGSFFQWSRRLSLHLQLNDLASASSVSPVFSSFPKKESVIPCRPTRITISSRPVSTDFT